MEVEKYQVLRKDGSPSQKNRLKRTQVIINIERGKSKMVDYAPGMRTIIRDEEWMVKK